MKVYSRLILCLLLITPGCTTKTDNDSVLDTIRLKDLNGNPVDLKQFKDKVVFINFWATWCAPCVAEMPSIQNAKEQLSEGNIEFLLASNESVDEISDFKERNKMDIQFVQLENLEELGIQVLPTTYIIDSTGTLVFSAAGGRQWDSADNIEMLKKFLNVND